MELAGEFKCPFEHEAEPRTENNKISPGHSNDSAILGAALSQESHHLKTIKINQPLKLTNGGACDEFWFSPHHLISG